MKVYVLHYYSGTFQDWGIYGFFASWNRAEQVGEEIIRDHIAEKYEIAEEDIIE